MSKKLKSAEELVEMAEIAIDTDKATEQKVEETKTEETPNPEDKPVLIPVFIGTELTDIIGLIEAILKDKFPDHIVAVLSPKMYAEMVYKYEFQSKSDAQKKSILDAQNNEEMRAQALDVAGKMDAVLRLPQYFTTHQLKQAYNMSGKNVSHKQVDEVVNFLGVYGYLRQVDTDVPAHKMRYMIVMNNQDIKNQIEFKNASLKLKIAQLTSELNGNEEELTNLIAKEDNSKAVSADNSGSGDTKPIKKSKSFKSKIEALK